MTMQALRFHAAKDLRVEEIEEPGRPGPGEVRIRNTRVGICGTDLHEYAYGPIFVPKEPHPFTGVSGTQILGHEFGGTVTDIGKGVTKVAVGDRVSVQPLIMPRDTEYYADRGLFFLSEKLALAGLSWPWGGMAEASILNDYNVYRIPDAMSEEEAALVEPTAVAVYACDRGGVRAGSSVLVTGAGPIGLLTVLAARAAGATRVFLSDPNAKRLELARTIDPDLVTIDPTKESVAERVRAGTDGRVGADVAMEAVRRQGVVVQVGLHPGPSKLDWFSVTCKDIDVRGSWAYPTTSWPRVIDLIATGRLPASKIVTKRIHLKDAVREGFDALLDPSGTQLKIMIDLTK